MSVSHIKNCCRVLQRAGINALIVARHGTAKTTIIQQLWMEEAFKRHGRPEQGGGSDDVDPALLSTLDSRRIVNLYNRSDQYRFCFVSIPNLTLEEIVGMPHVTDRAQAYRDLYSSSWQVAASVVRRDETSGVDVELLHAVQQEILETMCRDHGVLKTDSGLVLKYLRMSSVIPDVNHTGGGVMLADEINRGLPEVAQAYMQLFVSGTYLDYVLPDDFWIVSTMNPDDSGYQVRPLDPAIVNRCAVLVYHPDVEDFIDWSRRRGLNEHTRVFADKHRRLVNAANNVSEIKTGATCTFRSLEMVDRVWSVMSDKDVGSVGQSLASSILGTEAGVLYFKEATEILHRPLSPRDVLDGYGWSPTMTIDELRDYKSWPVTKTRIRLKAMVQRTNAKVELINETLRGLADWAVGFDDSLKSRGVADDGSLLTDVEKGQVLSLGLFLCDIPADIARAFINDHITGRFVLGFKWAGVFPVYLYLNKRISKNYRTAERESVGEQNSAY